MVESSADPTPPFRGLRGGERAVLRRAISRGTSLAAAVFLCLMPAAGGQTEDTVPQNQIDEIENLTRFFDSIVFDSEFDKGRHERVLAKWQTPLTIALSGFSADRHEWTIKHHARMLSDITGLNIRVLTPGARGANVVIRFVPATKMDSQPIAKVAPELLRQLAFSSGCYFVAYRDPPGQIVNSVIVVNSDRTDQEIRHCLLEEMVQSLGLPNDSNQMRPSIFSDHDRLVNLPRADTILLKTLYHPDMRPGYSRQQARDAAHRIIAALLAEEGGPVASGRR